MLKTLIIVNHQTLFYNFICWFECLFVIFAKPKEMNMRDKSRHIIRKIMRNSFLIGVASIFCPSVVHVDYLKMPNSDDAFKLNDDWVKIGSDMNKVYDRFEKGL